jgi:hypothetical protein
MLQTIEYMGLLFRKKFVKGEKSKVLDYRLSHHLFPQKNGRSNSVSTSILLTSKELMFIMIFRICLEEGSFPHIIP